jgi:hypothetical protein
METAPASFKVFSCRTREGVRECDYVASGCSSATSTGSCAATTHLPVARALPQPCHEPSCRSTSRRSVALARRALGHYVSRRDYSSSRLHQLYCLCCASGRVVLALDFLSVGRTGSRHASSHCISRRDYSSSGLHRLYCAYVMHLDVPSRHSTSRL